MIKLIQSISNKEVKEYFSMSLCLLTNKTKNFNPGSSFSTIIRIIINQKPHPNISTSSFKANSENTFLHISVKL